ncbi:NfeD family protein [Altererythrobacter aerius]|uniref:NfeD family protein n=1 Tax=Tsuneonella aeria TaxID=1837929 RepID=A0A6I4TI16_9SPHN|nr:NfeD family protein [Tsuneonella aeria]MXO75725.1 NfeD family protein [Tsuneonella aeria]
MNFFDGIEPHWAWIAFGLIIATLEMLIPGVYLLWFALAAVTTGLLALLFDVGLPLQIVEFVSLSLIFVYSARRMYGDRPIESSDPLMNNRLGRLVGQTGVVSAAIVHGEGRIRQGDSEWPARGPEIAAGERVRITGFDGGTLVVEPLTLLADEGTAPPAAG